MKIQIGNPVKTNPDKDFEVMLTSDYSLIISDKVDSVILKPAEMGLLVEYLHSTGMLIDFKKLLEAAS